MSKFDLTHASVAQINETKKEIESMERMLQADRTGSQRIQDEVEFKGEIAKKKKFLQTHVPKKFRVADGNKAYTYAKKLEKEISDAMPSRKKYFQAYPNANDTRREQSFEETVQMQMKFQSDKALKQKIQEYKHIMRRIDPDNPNITNIENLGR